MRRHPAAVLMWLLPLGALAGSALVASWAFGVTTCNTNNATQGPDTCIGTDGPQNVDLEGGNDTFLLADGGDVGRGSAGNDEVFGESGADFVNGGADQDRKCGSPCFVYYGVAGGDGGDEVRGSGGPDAVEGGGGDDRIYGEEQDDFVYADEVGTTNIDPVIDGGGGIDVCYVDGGEGGNVANCDGNVYYNLFG